MFHLESLMHPEYGCAPDCHFVAAGIRPAVEGGILPPGPALEVPSIIASRTTMPPGETPSSKADKMSTTTTAQDGGSVHSPGARGSVGEC